MIHVLSFYPAMLVKCSIEKKHPLSDWKTKGRSSVSQTTTKFYISLRPEHSYTLVYFFVCLFYELSQRTTFSSIRPQFGAQMILRNSSITLIPILR